MRIALALLALTTAACSTTGSCCNCDCGEPDRIARVVVVDTDDDGLPDQRIAGFGRTTFEDSDDDGLPDTRIVQIAPSPKRRLDRRLAELEEAIAELRRELQRR